MRVYFEKPRTTVSWKGLINDPHMDDSCDMREGLRVARRLLDRHQPHRFASRYGGTRSNHATVYRRPDRVGGDRSAHDRVADSSRNGQRAFDANRFQEYH